MKSGRLMAKGVTQAYFYALAKRVLYVDLPDEAIVAQHTCARLLKSLYGTCDAATIWSQAYTEVLLDISVKARKSKPCVYHPEQNTSQLPSIEITFSRLDFMQDDCG